MWTGYLMNLHTVFGEYVDTALWSSSCNGTATQAHADAANCRGEDCDTSLDSLGFTIDDLAPEAHSAMWDDVQAFVNSSTEERPEIFEGLTDGHIGHNLWLTRNGHGAGFWDAGIGERGDWLTAMAKPFGESSLYVNGDGKVEVQ